MKNPLVLLLLFPLLAPAAAEPQRRERSADIPELAGFDELKAHLEREAQAERFSGVVLVAKAGEPVFHEAFGFADRRWGIENELDTRFNLGSINKLFTGVAVLQLVEAGAVGLDDPIGKHVPELPAEVGEKVTVRHLLDHRSGWGAYWESEGFLARWRDLRTIGDYLEFLKDEPLEFEPGTQQRYSNTGFEILGALIERVAGTSYYEHVRENVYEPAGMETAGSPERDDPVPGVAMGYTGGGYARENVYSLAPRGTAAGGGYATSLDLLAFAQALADGRLISEENAARYRGGGFAGGAPGVRATLELDVAGDHTIVVLTNLDSPTATDVGAAITRMLGGGDGMGPPFRLGLGLEARDGEVVVSFLAPGGPAERDGLRAGDRIVAMNGEPVAPGMGMLDRIDAALETAKPLRFALLRGDERVEVSVTPERRE